MVSVGQSAVVIGAATHAALLEGDSPWLRIAGDPLGVADDAVEEAPAVREAVA